MPIKLKSPYQTEKGVRAGTAIKIGLGLGIAGAAGFAAYELITAFTTSQGPGCSQLQSELASVIKQQFDIYNNSVTYHGGTMTATQQGQIVALQKEQASLVAQIGKQCTPPAGQTLQEYLNKVIAYAGWTAIALIALGGVILSARMISWLVSKWGGGKTDPSSPPTSVEDASPPSDFTPTSVNMDFASGQTINNVDQNIITPEQGANTLSEVQSTDPLAVNATELSDAITAIADTEAVDFASLFDFLDAYAADMAAVETTDALVVSDAVDIIAVA